jgi:hypothetical protein
MNIKRGLLRIWFVLSAIFILATFTFMFDKLFNEFKDKYAPLTTPSDYQMLVPANCEIARGVKSQLNWEQLNAVRSAQERLSSSGGKETAPVADYDYVTSSKDLHCWYELPKFRALFPEYKDIRDKELSDRLYAKANNKPEPDLSPWTLLLKTLLFSIAVPLGFLILGWSALWAVAGFKSSTQ